MARHEGLHVPDNDFVQLTSADVAGMTIVNDGECPISIVPTADGVKPVSLTGRLILPPGGTILSDQLLAIIWPGIAAKRVWAQAWGRGGHAQVSHG